MSRNEEQFTKKLKEIFVGAEVEGDSGFIKLMKIKETYFVTIFKEILKEIEKKTNSNVKFKEELFEKLTTFMKKYFSESGSIYFTYTPLKHQVFEKVYDANNDVTLFWKTNMLYYVKTEQLFQNLTIIEEICDTKYKIVFDVSDLKHKKANEKKHIIYEIKKIEAKKIIFSVKHHGTKMSATKKKEIIKKLKIKNIHTDEIHLENIFKTFQRQNKMDYFINKNAKEFLQSQFDYWMKNYLLENLDFKEERLKQLKIIRDITYKIIDFVAQFEDELKNIWNKPKFALDGNYVISLNKINEKKEGSRLLKKIFSEKAISEQIKEWDKLLLTKNIEPKDIFKSGKLEKKYQYLTIDTCHFSEEIKLELLSLFENIENELDGWLIKSENYQALNTILNKFKNKVDCIYIDPPFNAPNSEVNYENNFKHSTWLTMIDNRIELGQEMMKKSASMAVAIGEDEHERLGLLLEKKFSKYEKTCVSIIHNAAGTQVHPFAVNNEFTYFLTPPGKKLEKVERNEKDWKLTAYQIWGSNQNRGSSVNQFYPIYVNEKNEIVEIGKGQECDVHPKKQTIKTKDGYEIWPIKEKADGSVDYEGKWRWSESTLNKKMEESMKKYNIPLLKVTGDNNNKKIEVWTRDSQFKTTWVDSKYIAGDNGTNILTNLGINKDITGYEDEKVSQFTFPKSIYNVKDCIFAVTENKKDSLILDFFGGSGTTAHATMELNKDDGGKRKFIVTEMGDHFDYVIIPRIKKIAFNMDWRKWEKGSPTESDGMNIFFKYYKLEQYDDTLRKVVYKETEPLLDLDDKSIYQQYVFFKDEKMLKAVEVDKKEKKIKIDFSKIYPEVDIAETLSNIMGKSIKKIEESKVIFDDDEEIKFDEIEFNDIKSLIWW